MLGLRTLIKFITHNIVSIKKKGGMCSCIISEVKVCKNNYTIIKQINNNFMYLVGHLYANNLHPKIFLDIFCS